MNKIKNSFLLLLGCIGLLIGCDLQPKISSIPDSIGVFIENRFPALLADPETQPEIYNSAVTDYGVYSSPELYGSSNVDDYVMYSVNAVTNGGFYVYPTLLKRGVGAIRGERVVDSDISANIRQIMFQIAEQTTAKSARVKGIEIGGKTGTAEKHINGQIDKSKNVATFVGIFPVSAPQYVIVVMLDEPQATKETGGWHSSALNAVPTAGAILDGIMPLLF